MLAWDRRGVGLRCGPLLVPSAARRVDERQRRQLPQGPARHLRGRLERASVERGIREGHDVGVHAILGVEQVHVALPVDGLLEQAHAQARLQGRRILDCGRQLKGIARENHALGRPDGNPCRGLQGLTSLVEDGRAEPAAGEHAVSSPDQGAADDLRRLQRPLGEEALEAVGLLPQFPGLSEGRTTGGALVRPESPELLFGFAGGLLRLFPEGLDLLVVRIGGH